MVHVYVNQGKKKGLWRSKSRLHLFQVYEGYKVYKHRGEHLTPVGPLTCSPKKSKPNDKTIVPRIEIFGCALRLIPMDSKIKK